MQGRTFLRIMLDNLFVNNILCKTIVALINFCKEQSYYNQKELKFLNKMPLIKLRQQKNTYNKKFIFKNNQSSGVYFD